MIIINDSVYIHMTFLDFYSLISLLFENYGLIEFLHYHFLLEFTQYYFIQNIYIEYLKRFINYYKYKMNI